jgi:hypothetical protein
MGSVIRLLVLAAMIAVGVRIGPAIVARYTQPPPADAPEIAEPEVGPSSDASAPAGDAADAREQAPDEAGRTYYRYMDGGGSLRFVDSLDAVPEAFGTPPARSMSAQAMPTRPHPDPRRGEQAQGGARSPRPHGSRRRARASPESWSTRPPGAAGAARRWPG